MTDEDMSDTEVWREYKRHRQVKRAANRETSAQLLRNAGIPFIERNGGAHLIVAEQYDFWPGTGLWKSRRNGQTQRGVHSLIRRLKTLEIAT